MICFAPLPSRATRPHSERCSGAPLADATVDVTYKNRPVLDMLSRVEPFRQSVTGSDGSFSIDTVLPGLEFRVNPQWKLKRVTRDPKREGLKVESGQTEDLGDLSVTMEPDRKVQ